MNSDSVDSERQNVGSGAAQVEACGFAVAALARALELHDHQRGAFAETGSHLDRVTALAWQFTEDVAPDLAADPIVAHGYRLHDIGMIGVASSILVKREPLTRPELDEIREHPWLGERIVATVPPLNGVARQVIACHHEKWDGSGYPRGLRGGEIPLAARIFALVDAFDVMTNDQPYRHALPFELAVAEIEAKAGTHFDPDLATAFLRMLEAIEIDLPDLATAASAAGAAAASSA